jgi:ubiquinone/menaquinone biosynthesis C-methylase UbiE
MTTRKKDWFREWFNEDYRLVYRHRKHEDSRKEVAFVSRTLGLSREARILDLCCGAARHLIPLWEAGHGNLVGLDLSAILLGAAQRAMKRAGASARLVRGDMLHLPFVEKSFDYVLSFFSSFGYFETDEENTSVLSEMIRVLKPGGILWLDAMNPDYVLGNLEPETQRREGGWEIREERRYVPEGKRIEKTVAIRKEGENRTYRESVRLYDLSELEAIIAKVGARVASVFGDYAEIPSGPETPRLIVVSRKGETTD